MVDYSPEAILHDGLLDKIRQVEVGSGFYQDANELVRALENPTDLRINNPLSDDFLRALAQAFGVDVEAGENSTLWVRLSEYDQEIVPRRTVKRKILYVSSTGFRVDEQKA